MSLYPYPQEPAGAPVAAPQTGQYYPASQQPYPTPPAGYQQPPAQVPAAYPSPDADDGRWRALGIIMIATLALVWIVEPLLLRRLVLSLAAGAYNQALEQVFLRFGPAICAFVVVAVAPATTWRKRLSCVWLTVYLLTQVPVLVMVGSGVGPGNSPVFGTVMSVALSFAPPVALGWWITLRGRPPRSYWTLLVAGVVFWGVGLGWGRLTILFLPGNTSALTVLSLVEPLVHGFLYWGLAWLAAKIGATAGRMDALPR